jgi:hypothetical protein
MASSEVFLRSVRKVVRALYSYLGWGLELV